MKMNLSFRECKKFIEALKEKAIFLGVKGDEVGKKLENETWTNKVVNIVGKNERVFVISSEEGFSCYFFKDDNFEKKEILASLETYFQNSYNFSLFELDVNILISFLESNEKTLLTVQEEINFEMGWGLKTGLLASPEISCVIYVWQKGPVLLCKKMESGEERILLSNSQNNIEGEDAVQKIRHHHSNFPCSIKVLKRHVSGDEKQEEDMMVVELDLPLPPEEEDITSSKKEEKKEKKQEEVKKLLASKEDSVVTLDENLPELTEADKEIFEKYGIPLPAGGEEKLVREESVIQTDEELPQLTDADMEIYRKYGIPVPGEEEEIVTSRKTKIIMEESEIPLDENASPEEIEIFSKYGIDIPDEEETTRQELRDKFEESVVVKDELPVVGPDDISVLKKYGINLKEEEEKKETKSRIAANKPVSSGNITKHEVKILEKYGIRLARKEKSSIQEIKEAYKLANALKVLSKEVSERDAYVFQKFGLRVPKQSLTDKYGPQLKQTARIAYEKVKKTNPLFFIVPIVSVIVIYIISVIINIHQVRQIEAKKIQQKKDFCIQKIKYIDDHSNLIKEKVDKFGKLVKDISKSYPANQGYPQPTPRILKRFEEIKLYDKKVGVILDNVNILKNENLDKTQEYIRNNFSRIEKKYVDQIDKLSERVYEIRKMAEFMHRSRMQDQKIRTVLRNLKEYIDELKQEIIPFKDKLNVYNKTYKGKKGFPPFSIEVAKVYEKATGEIENLNKKLKKIEEAYFRDEIENALVICKNYIRNYKKFDLTLISEKQEYLDEYLKLCRKISAEKKEKRECTDKLEILTQKAKLLNDEMDLINKGVRILNSFPQKLDIPRSDKNNMDVINKAKTILSNVTRNLRQAKQFLYQKEIGSALKSLSEYSIDNNFIEKVKQVRENIENDIQIANSTKEKTEKGRLIAQLLNNVGQSKSTIEYQIKDINKKYSLINSKFSGSQYPSVDESYKNYLHKANEIGNELNKVYKDSKTYIRQKRFDSALSILKSSRNTVKNGNFLIKKLEEISKDLTENISKSEMIYRNLSLYSEINTKITRVDDYIASVKKHLTPLKENLAVIDKDFSDEGYQKVSGDVFKIAKVSEQKIEYVSKEVEKARNLLMGKRWGDAKKSIEKIAKSLSKDFSKAVRQANYQVEDVLYYNRKIQKNRDKIAKAKKLLTELRNRQKNIKGIVPDYEDILNKLENEYPARKGFFPPTSSAKSVLREIKLEIKELDRAIADGDELFEKAKYDQLWNELRVYSETVNRAITKLPVLKSIYEKLKEIFDKNKKMKEDPSFRIHVEKERKLKKEKEVRRQQWATAPGDWYDSLDYIIAVFDSIKGKLSISFKDAGALYTYGKINARIAEMKRYKKYMADLRESLFNISQKGGDIQKLMVEKEQASMTPKQFRQIRLLKKYLTNQYKIDVNVAEELASLKTDFNTLQNKLQIAKWVTKEDIKNIKNKLERVDDKFKEAYEPVSSLLINLDKNNQIKI